MDEQPATTLLKFGRDENARRALAALAHSHRQNPPDGGAGSASMFFGIAGAVVECPLPTPVIGGT